jgi:hypothetical protein
MEASSNVLAHKSYSSLDSSNRTFDISSTDQSPFTVDSALRPAK